MAIEIHDAGNGETFCITTDFLECGNCSAIITNKTRADGTVTCATCGSEWEPDELANARAEEIVAFVVDAANLNDQVAALQNERDALKSLLADHLAAWDGEEDSVKEEHAALIDETRQSVNGKD